MENDSYLLEVSRYVVLNPVSRAIRRTDAMERGGWINLNAVVYVMRIAEADWKVFKVVRAEALDRFCRTVLHECRAISDDESRTAHERYLDLYRYIRERDRAMARAFDDFRRSTAVLCLMRFHQLGLLTEEEIARFSEDVQRDIRRDP